MTDFDSHGFLAEVIADPDNDVPRLIYADWLEEQGSSRGEFIRIHCELHGMDHWEPQFLDMKLRNDRLLEVHGKQWADELNQDVRKSEYTRGFVETVTVTARVLARTGDELFRKFPVRWLRLNFLKGTSAQWSDCDCLEKVEFLDLAELKIPDEDLLALLTAPGLTNLRGLRLGGLEQIISRDVAAAVCSPPIAQHLEELDVHGRDDAIRSLWTAARQSVGFPELRRLALRSYSPSPTPMNLDGIPFGPLEKIVVGDLNLSGAEQIASLPLTHVQKLKVDSIPAGGLQELAACGALDSVQELDLGHSELGIRGAESLFCNNHLQNCDRLSLFAFLSADQSRHNDELIELIELLTSHAPLKTLRELKVSHLQAGHLSKIARSPFFPNLESLELRHCQPDADDLRAFTESSLASRLRNLQMYHTCPPADGFAHLARGTFANLVRFVVDHQYSFGTVTQGIESPVMTLIESNAMPALQVLIFRQLNLTEATLMSLADRSLLPELRLLNFDINYGSNESMCRVLESERLPKLRSFSLKRCRGLRRSKKLTQKYTDRLTY